MTCIVGLVAEGQVWLGGDRAAVDDGHYLAHVVQPKVFRRGDFVFGYTSSFRMGQLLQHRLEIPALPEHQPLDEYMVLAFAEAVRSCLKDGGYTKIENSRETVGRFLVGVRGHLYSFDDDYNLLRTICGYDALGSGISVARGSLHTSAKLGLTPHERVLFALEAASEHTTTVRAPFDVIAGSLS